MSRLGNITFSAALLTGSASITDALQIATLERNNAQICTAIEHGEKPSIKTLEPLYGFSGPTATTPPIIKTGQKIPVVYSEESGKLYRLDDEEEINQIA
mgnify:CR=1 FL=1